VKQVGYDLATATLIDSTRLRMVLVPAVMARFGKARGGCRAGSNGSLT